MSAQPALFEVETMGGLECPHCGCVTMEPGERVAACEWIVGKTGLQVLPWPEHCLNRPDPATMRIPF